MTTWSGEYLTMVQDCEKRRPRLSEWESGFIESIRDRLRKDIDLTVNQINTLNNIWERVTAQGWQD